MQNCCPDPEWLQDASDLSQQSACADARLIRAGSADYPEAIMQLRDRPQELWARGTLSVAAPPAVAIVGTRTATEYGLRVSRLLATACARAGVCVVSGLARGIDGAAHEAALQAGGRTVAVLGTGVDCYYPRNHRSLQERIARDGLLLSEHAPGSTGHGGAFPRRNRIIAALANVVVIVEAGQSSGALITASFAKELGIPIAVVPGPIDSPASAGSNELLLEMHTPLLSPAVLLEMLALDPSPPLLPAVDGHAAQCWDAIRHGAVTVADIAKRSSLDLRKASSAITALELDGLVAIDSSGRVHATIAVPEY
jgi:DNA processing protein